MPAAIGTTLDFERLHVVLDGKSYVFCGHAEVVGTIDTWAITGIVAYDPTTGAARRFKRATEIFETFRIALHRQCAAAISARLNHLVEHHGGYAILHGVEIPADPYRRRHDRHSPATGRTVWLDAA